MTEPRPEVPENWDEIADRGEASDRPGSGASFVAADRGLPIVTLMAASWADLSTILAVCTIALLALLALGETPALPVFPWTVALAFGWWVISASVLLVIRQGTPGMLLAGVAFKEQVRPKRVVAVLTAALVSALALGLPGLLGPGSSPLRLAAGSPLTSSDGTSPGSL